MPLVRLTAQQHGYEIPPEAPLKKLLIREGGMDGSDADAAVHRLSGGKFVDISFDLGEEQAAKAFVGDAKAVGLEAMIHRDEPLSWTGSRPRPWFLKLALAVLIGFGICVWLSVTRPNTVFTHVCQVTEGLVFIGWLYSYAVDNRPKTQEQRDWELRLISRWRLALFVLVAVIVAIISEPILGLVVLALALGGIGFAVLIRIMNQN